MDERVVSEPLAIVAIISEDGDKVKVTINIPEESPGYPEEKEKESRNRKTLAKLEKLGEEEDSTVCSICLDEFTEEDPAVKTVCQHGYHLQCVMQWAQRSRECPLCFMSLKLNDPDMNELLPFGEYVDPHQLATTESMLETWELERFLVRLAQAERRAARHSRCRRVALPESSAPRTIIGRRSAHSYTSGNGEVDTTDQAGDTPTGVSSASHAYPSSWPPSTSQQHIEASDTRSSVEGSLSPMFQGLKSRLASLRSSTARELKHLFGSPSPSHSRS